MFTERPSDVDANRPLIYLWVIRARNGAVIGRYVGKASGGARRPRRHYARNVANILAGKPYRKGKPQGYRRVHRVMADALRQGGSVTLELLCNVPPGASIDALEQAHIERQGSRGDAAWQLNG